ncbi:cytohesin-interacting protein [Protopterus annectens]|uniref:cytohesin-interacting protein n=1 Tax=Protopterus annectens TaxID=7888 RepID=UPI001CF9A476|nr:cytohesin-interacting protein [Protopterus annectens]
MSLNQMISEQNCNEKFVANDNLAPTCSSKLPHTTGFHCDSRKTLQTLADTFATLPRGRNRQLILSRTNSLVDAEDSERKLHILVKQDNQTFGFEIQTHVSNHPNADNHEVCTFVYRVHDGTCAQGAGLKPGDILVNINGVSTEGFSHHDIVTHIKSSGNLLRLETVQGAILKKLELETKLRHLKRALKKKETELHALLSEEQRLLRGLDGCQISEAVESPGPNISDSSPVQADPVHRSRLRFSSASSCRSQLSFMTEDSEDGFFSSPVFEDSCCDSPWRRASIDEDCFFQRDIDMPVRKCTLSRNRSISIASNSSGSLSPSWDMNNCSNIYGTIPRKTRKGSIRRRFMKFIPGLNRSVEEEESSF